MRRVAIAICSVVLVAHSAHALTTNATCSRKAYVTLHVKDQNVRTVLRSIAQQGDLNISISPQLSGSISADFDCEQPRRIVKLLVTAIDALSR